VGECASVVTAKGQMAMDIFLGSASQLSC